MSAGSAYLNILNTVFQSVKKSSGLSVSVVALLTVVGSGNDRFFCRGRVQRLEAERKYALQLLPETVVEPSVEKDVVAGG